MLISGLQKLSLVDFPGKVACTVFTGGCNWRCPFCHNSELIHNPPREMEVSDVLDFLGSRRGLLDGVCITGGEPCLHADLPDLMRAIRDLGYPVKLDTNGTFPDRLKAILDEGLAAYVAMDIKNSPEMYGETTGASDSILPAVLRSARLLLASGTDFELRTTVVLPFHSLTSMQGIRDMLDPLVEEAGRLVPHYYLQPFVDRDTVAFSGMSAPGDEDLRAWCGVLAPIARHVGVRGK